MPFDFYVFVVMAFAGLVKGLTGFGLSLVAVPLLILSYDPKTIVPTLLMYNLFFSMALFFKVRQLVDYVKIRILWGAALLGILVGTHVFMLIDITYLKIAISIIVVIFSILLLFKREFNRKWSCFETWTIGLISGFLNATTSMSGPPVVLYIASQNMQKEKMRATLLGYFSVLYIFTTITFYAKGLLTHDIFSFSFYHAVPTLCGMLAGTALVKKVDQNSFRRFTLFVVLGTGIFGVISGAGLL